MGRVAAQWVLAALCVTSAGVTASPATEKLVVPSVLDDVAVELREVVVALDRDALPRGLVVHKIQEGAAKEIAPERVLAAARGVASDLRLVAKIARKRKVRPDARPAIIVAGVVAHRAGIPLISIDAIVGEGSREDPEIVVVALRAAADLGGRGYPRDGSAELVLRLLRRDARGQELPRTLAVVEAVRRATGLEAEQALAKVVAGVEAGQGLQEAGRAAAGRRGG